MLYVERLHATDAEHWDRLLRESPGGGHVLQSYAWGQVKASEGWTPLYLVLKEDGQVRGTAQIVLRQPLKGLGAVAYCPKGPWLDWAQETHVQTMLDGMEHFARQGGAMVLKIESELLAGVGLPTHRPPTLEEPLHAVIDTVRRARGVPPLPQADADHAERIAEARAAILAARAEQEDHSHAAARATFAARGYVKSLWDMQFRTTMIVDLDRVPEAMLARMKSKWRYNINLARRKGVTITEDTSPGALHLLYDMYLRTAARDGFHLRPRDYFEKAWATMIAAGYIRLFFACHEGRTLAALMLFTFGDKAWYQVGASETEGRNVMPAHALQFHAMQWAWEHGIRLYDMVAIPNADAPENDPMWGLYIFKAGFGGRPVEWAGCLDKILDPRGHAWEALESLYFRLYRWRTGNVFY